MKKRLCVYTCITGNYDNLKEVDKEKDIDYYCFTNNSKIKSNSWNVILIENNKLSNVQLARKIKILGHPIINDNYKYSFWMDGDIIVKKSINDFIKKFYDFSQYDFLALKHHCRNTVLDEMIACVQCRKESVSKIKRLQDFYKKDKYLDNNGLIESTIFIKNNESPSLKDTMQIWFDMLIAYTHRDQLTFNYALSKTNLKVQWLNLNIWNNEWFFADNHKTTLNLESYRIYFGNDCNSDFKIDSFIDKKYSNNDEQKEIEIMVKKDTNVIELFLAEGMLIKITDFKYNKNAEIMTRGFFDQDNKSFLSYMPNASIVLNGKFKKDTKILISFHLSKILEKNLMLEFQDINKEITDLKLKNKQKDEVINKMENGLSWKITKPLRKIGEIIRHNS